VTFGKSKVGVKVMVGVREMVGVGVRVGGNVSVGVGVLVGVEVALGVGVPVHMAAVAVCAVAVMVNSVLREEPQAEMKMKSRMRKAE
jgi:UDP-3-O-[3-hydroxymyristoyl] glucosamine N-acyltransferase